MKATTDSSGGGFLRTVELYRKREGFGFTLSGQGPCVLSCILKGSPAQRAGLKPGDQIIEVNTTSVVEATHEQVVNMIARSPDGMVRLGVRKRAEMQRQALNGDKMNGENSEEAMIKDTILNRVDKVVEELKSGQLFGDSPSLCQTLSNGKFVSEEEVVSDEELKASFCESVRSESSVPGSSPAQSHSSSRRSSEGDVASIPSSPKLSRLLYPKMTPLKNHVQADIDLEPELRSIVGYLGSIELPAASSLPAASLTAIRNCVRRLRAQQKVHVFFLMEISLVGIKLVDSEKRTIVTYPLKSLAFTGLCSDDKRVFGIVTRKNNEVSMDQGNNRQGTWHAQNNHKIDVQSAVNCSCHVFSVNPELRPHEAHQRIAEKYGIQCTPQDGEGGCVEFPGSSSSILKTITGMFQERRGSESGGTSSEGEVNVGLGRQSLSLSSSQSESDMPVRQHHLDGGQASEPPADFVDSKVFNGLPQGLELSQSLEQAANELHEFRSRVGEQYQTAERNDSGVGSDSFHQNDSEAVTDFTNAQESRSSRPVPPVVNVSSFHSRESSGDSQFSMGSHQSSLVGGVPVTGILRKPRSNSEGEQTMTKDLSLSNSQEVSIMRVSV